MKNILIFVLLCVFLVHQEISALETESNIDTKNSNVTVGHYKFKIPEDLGDKIRNTLNTIDTLSHLVLPSKKQEPRERQFFRERVPRPQEINYTEENDFIGPRNTDGNVRRKILQAIVQEYF